MVEGHSAQPPLPPPEAPPPAQSGYSQHSYSAGGRTTLAGRDVRSGMPAGYVVLCLLIVAAMAVAVLLVAVNLAPPSSANAGVQPQSSPTAGVVSSPAPSSVSADLSYQLTASPSPPRTVKVAAKASGEPEPGLTYWFMLEVDYRQNTSAVDDFFVKATGQPVSNSVKLHF